jgi:hypothetical protein
LLPPQASEVRGAALEAQLQELRMQMATMTPAGASNDEMVSFLLLSPALLCLLA